MSNSVDKGRPFTGYHMILVMVAFFGTIITVNFIMAYYANRTWSGLVVPNSYVASQQFNKTVADVKEQDARGWKDQLSTSGGEVRFGMTSANGAQVTLTSVTMIFRRPVTDRADATVELKAGANGEWSATHPLGDGIWIAEIDVTSPNEKPWRDTKRFTVKDGEIR